MRFTAVRRTSVEELLEPAASYVSSNPLVATAVAVAAVAFLVGLWLVVRWIRRPMGARLKRHLEKHDEVAVLMHPNPDPDAMACAIAVERIAESVGTDVTIQYPGQIRHQENRAFRTVLDLGFDRITHVDDLAADHVVLVDHNVPRGFDGAERVVPHAVIDHHPGGGTGEAFTDHRTEYGACASILAEYLQDLNGVPVGPDDDASEVDGLAVTADVATGMLYGIQSDTKQLTNGCHRADFSASAYLFEGADEDLLERIANPQVSAEVLEVKARAISSRDVRGSFAVSDVGEIGDADAIPQAADELMALEGVTAVVVYGQRDGTIHFSGRSRDDRVHMGRTLEGALSGIREATAGGHARMGGGQVPVKHVAGPYGSESNAGLWSRTELSDRLFDAMNGVV